MADYRIIHGDCLEEMRNLVGETFHLVYADPPFLSQADYHTTDGTFAYSDKWADPDEYFAFLTSVCGAVRDLLTDDGCFVLHVDPRTSHRLKLVLDGVFGERCFASEIIWRYRRWPTKTQNFQRMHDVLLRYVKTPGLVRWNQLYEPPAESTLKQWGTGKQRAVVENGRRSRSSVTDEPSPGVPMSDVWDIGIVAPSSNERTGWPTQKPEALLTRIIGACSHPGDRVLDPFCGSGTTIAAAVRMGRDAVGIDASDVAIRYATERMQPPLETQRQPSLFEVLP